MWKIFAPYFSLNYFTFIVRANLLERKSSTEPAICIQPAQIHLFSKRKFIYFQNEIKRIHRREGKYLLLSPTSIQNNAFHIKISPRGAYHPLLLIYKKKSLNIFETWCVCYYGPECCVYNYVKLILTHFITSD